MFRTIIGDPPLDFLSVLGENEQIMAQVAPGVAESEVLRRRPNRVLRDYGWTKDGRIRLAYRLSKALAGNGVPSIPAAMKGLIEGEFQIKTPDGTRFGKFVSGESGAWGLGPLFRRRGAEPDDFLLLILDLNRREAIAYLGDESVLEDPGAMQEATTAANSSAPDGKTLDSSPHGP